MCSQYTTCKGNITRKILTNIISGPLYGDLLQDALGILHFPPSDKLLIRKHVAQWTAKAFPDPFRRSSYDHDTISKLHCIFSRIIIFTEDYVSKATDPYPPRAYLALPPIAPGGDRLSKGKTVDIKPVSFSSLTVSEKRRSVGAFLKHEMICKVYNPQVWGMLKDTRYATLLSEEDEKLSPTELKELYCVHEYIKTAYGASSLTVKILGFQIDPLYLPQRYLALKHCRLVPSMGCSIPIRCISMQPLPSKLLMIHGLIDYQISFPTMD